MTRINTNVSSLVARTVLQRSNNDLQTALARLSTGLRINSGKDDPAGLIASEILRSDIISTEKAITNSERANQLVATADSALGQVSKLLNDVRGLISEAANSGVLSEEQVAANQLQVDSSLEAINRIAQTTQFQGRRLLDGSLEFQTTAGTNFGTVTDLQIDQANLGATGQVAVSVSISSAATRAQITNSAGFSTATNASAQLKFSAELNFDNSNFATNAELFFQATAPGATLEGATIQFVGQTGLGAGNETASYNSTTKILTVTVDQTAATTAGNIASAVNSQVTEFHVTTNGQDAQAVTAAEALALAGTTTADFLTITAANPGPQFNNTDVVVVADATVAFGTPTAAYDAAANRVTIRVNNSANTTLANIVTAFGAVAEFSAAASATAADESLNIAAGNTSDFNATANTGTTGGATLLDTLVFELKGKTGSDVLSFGSGTTINQVRDAVNLISDATGVTATVSGTTLTVQAADYGDSAFVDLNVISEGTSGTFAGGLSATRATGADIVATVNGAQAKGDGNTLSINTATLDFSATVTDGSSTDFAFTIDGGGALFQIGQDVVSTQQARLGIAAVNAARLGRSSGKLFQIGSGEAYELSKNPNQASRIVEESINEVTALRGRLGAFQRTTLDTNIAALNETLGTLTEAESSIRDADFAAESARLTRAQILVQSGTAVLQIANSNPQNVLALLR